MKLRTGDEVRGQGGYSVERVRLLYVSDPASALEWLDQSAVGKRERERASSDGVFGLVGQRLVSGEWETVNSVWGFIGDDGLDAGGYASDIMSEVLDAVEAEALAVVRGMLKELA